MDRHHCPEVSLLALAILFMLLALLLPILRLRMKMGIFAVVFSSREDPIARWVGAWLGIALGSVLLWPTLLVLGLGPSLNLWSWPAWTRQVGWVIAGTSLALIMLAQAQMGASWRIGIDAKKTELVTTGLFALSRNPIYFAVVLFSLSLVLLTPSSWTVCGLAISVLMVGLQARLEEQHLHKVHGEAYARYAARVGRFVPGLGRLPHAPPT